MSGSTSCYPVVAGSLPTTAQRARGDFGCQRAKRFSAGCRKGQAGNLCSQKNYRFLYLEVGRGRGAGRGLDVGVDLGVARAIGMALGVTVAVGVEVGLWISSGGRLD